METAMLPFLPAGAAVLDFGSGPVPALTLLLRERGFRASAFDPCFAASRAWRREAWDAIALHEVAEHLRRPARTSSYLAARLVPGGILAFRTRFAPRREEDFASWWYRRDPTHIGFFRPSSFARLADGLGLELLRLEEPDLAVLRRRR